MGGVAEHNTAGRLPLRERVVRGLRRRVRTLLLPLWPREGITWDRRAGVSTEPFAELDELTIAAGAAGTGHPYVPTPPRLAAAWLDVLPAELVAASTLVDMGSGRGRVLLMGAEKPFRRVIGVEFAAELHAAAEANISSFPAHRLRCDDVRSQLGDAAEFAFPPGPLVIYFDNPFAEPVMRQVLANLEASYEQEPRPIVAVYQQVIHEGDATRTDNLGMLDDQPFLSGRTLRFRLRDRPFLRSFVVRIHRTPEVATLVDRPG